jgi:hypothetical protein
LFSSLVLSWLCLALRILVGSFPYILLYPFHFIFLAPAPFFPNEILVQFFVVACFLFSPQERGFVATRCRLALVSCLWRDIVISTPALWRHLAIDSLSTVVGMDAFLHYSHDRPFRLSFGVPRGLISHDVILASALYLVPTAHRWQALSIRIDNSSVVHALLSFFVTLSAPILSYISIDCVLANFYRVDSLYAVAPLIFGGSIQALSALHLVGLPLPWVTFQPLPVLVYLSLHGLLETSWPTFAVFVALLDTAPALRHLSLGDVGLKDVPFGALVSLPFIHSLELFFGVGTGLYGLLSSFTFPSLHQLHLDFINTLSLRTFLDYQVAFSAPIVRLATPCSQTDLLRSLYARVSHVCTLDLRRCDDAALQALHFRAEQTFADIVFPSLSRLIIFSPPWPVLHSVLQSRISAAASSLAILHCEIPSALSPRLSLATLVASNFGDVPSPSVPSSDPHVLLSSFPHYQEVLACVAEFAWIPVAKVSRRSSFSYLPDLI